MNPNKIEYTKKCPDCDNTHLIRDFEHGELVCSKCGLVIEEDYVDQGPEWRAFDSQQQQNRSRTGAPLSIMLHDKGLSTEIGYENKDSHGKHIPSRNRPQVFRMRKWQQRTRASNSAERNLSVALREISTLAEKIGLPRSIKEDAAAIYRQAVYKNLIRGRNMQGVVAASLYAACRQNNHPRALFEVSKASNLTKKEVGRIYRFLKNKVGIKLKPTSPQDYVSRFCSDLGLSGEVEKEAREILARCEEAEITSGRGPTGLAAAGIYIASVLMNDRRTQKEIGDVSGVTEVTVRNRYKEIVKTLGIEISV